MVDAAELLESYIAQGGKDLGEFLLGSENRLAIKPAADPNHFLGDFEGLQQKLDVNFTDLAKHIGAAKPASLKRMIGNNRVSNGDAIDGYSEKLGFEQGGKHDVMFWHLARGDKSLPSIEKQTEAARKALRQEDANPQQIARDLANNLLARSGFTAGKLGRMGPAKGMMKELTRSEKYEFSVERADQLSHALVPEQARKARTIGNVFLGLDKQKSVTQLLDEVEQDEKTFGDVIRQIRLQRRQTQREFGEKLTNFIKRHDLVEGDPTIFQATVQKWETNKVPFQGEAMVDAITKFIGFKEEHDRYKDCVPVVVKKEVPEKDRVTKEQWLEQIRGGDLEFKQYLRTTMDEEGLNYVDFGKSITFGEDQHVGVGAVSKWMRGGVANTKHAEALAEREGITEAEDIKDFMAFARTGKLDRSNRETLLDDFLVMGIPLAEFIFTIRSEEGQTPEECDEMIGLGRGAVRNIEAGRELRTDNANRLADYMQPELGDRRDEFVDRVAVKGKAGPSDEGIDPVGYKKLLEKSLEFGSIKQLRPLRQATPDIRFNHHDPTVEVWWRNKALQSMMRPNGEMVDNSAAWNDLHDLLYGQLNQARLEHSRFSENISTVMSEITNMGDERATRRAMNATMYRQIHEEVTETPLGRREQIALAARALNRDFIESTVFYENNKYDKTKLDETLAFDEASDKFGKIMQGDYINNLMHIDAYISRSVINVMHSMARANKSKGEISGIDSEILANMPEQSVDFENPFDTTGRDVLALLVHGIDKLSADSREVLQAMLNLPPDTRSVYNAVKEHIDEGRLSKGENQIPMGTVKSRIHKMRRELVNIDELRESVEDLFGMDVFNDGPTR